MVTIIGWLGFIFCSLAYLLLNLTVLQFNDRLYQVLNVIGGIGLVISACYFRDMPNIAANGIWVLIALFGIIRYFRQHSGVRRRSGRVMETE